MGNDLRSCDCFSRIAARKARKCITSRCHNLMIQPLELLNYLPIEAPMANDKSMIHGNCLCGAVSISLQQHKPSISACHCGICRNWSGGPFLSLESHETPVIEGEEHVRSYASSEWAERSFCDVCGTHLFYKLKAGGFHAISAGLFNDSGSWPFELQVFIDDKPGNYTFANKTREMTGEEVVKLFS